MATLHNSPIPWQNSFCKLLCPPSVQQSQVKHHIPYWQPRLEQLEGLCLAVLHRIMLAVLPARAPSLLCTQNQIESVKHPKISKQCCTTGLESTKGLSVTLRRACGPFINVRPLKSLQEEESRSDSIVKHRRVSRMCAAATAATQCQNVMIQQSPE